MKTILLADDDDDDVFLFRNALAQIRQDVKIITARNGVDCMNLLMESSLPDLIFLDINMPLKTGLECLEEIRKDDRLKKLKVVVLSTASTRDLVDTAYKKGANLYLRKSFSFEEFKKILAKCFSDQAV